MSAGRRNQLMKVYDNDIAEIFFNRDEIKERINELGAQITADL